MRKALRVICWTLLLLMGWTNGAPAQGETRLRVVARGDSALAQEEKLRVRDALLAVCPVRAEGLPRAWGRLAVLAERAGGKLSLRFWSPDAAEPPALTVYVTLGEGRGKNWWGILYPDAAKLVSRPDPAQSANDNSPDNAAFISDKSSDAADPISAPAIRVVWPWWNWLKHLFGR